MTYGNLHADRQPAHSRTIRGGGPLRLGPFGNLGRFSPPRPAFRSELLLTDLARTHENHELFDERGWVRVIVNVHHISRKTS
jgi:hypothetical protein